MKKVFGLLLAITLLVTILSFPPIVGAADNWVSPTGHNDPDSKWVEETKAYDGNTATYAINVDDNWTYYLELNIAAITCDKVRIYAQDWRVDGTANPSIAIDVYYASAWHNIFSGGITKDVWVEKAVGSTEVITAARVKHNTGVFDLRLFEFEFNSILPVVETDACTGVKSTSFDANGDIIVSGGATKRGFHYSKVFDNFEWGSDTDPLSDDGGAIDWTIEALGTSKVEIDTAQHYTGTRSAMLEDGGGNPAKAKFTQAAISNQQIISFALRKDTGDYFVVWHGNGAKYIRITIPTSESILYYDGSHHATGAILPVDTWQIISLQNVDWGAGTFDIYLEGVLIQSAATMATSASFGNEVFFYSELSICWLDEVAVWDVEDEDGSYGIGEYDLEITGLDPATNYYVQAFTENSVGFGYGNVVSQLTLTPTGYSWGTIIG